MNKYQNIFTPLTIKNMTIRNRVAMPPMGTNYGGAMGDFTEEHVQYYEKRAKGGTGLIIEKMYVWISWFKCGNVEQLND